MEQVVLWGELCALVEPHYPKPWNVRTAVGVERMLRIYFCSSGSDLLRRFSGAGPALGERVLSHRWTKLKYT
jgi:hypothetical protein